MFHLEAGTLHHNYQQPKLSGTGLRGFLGERSCLVFPLRIFRAVCSCLGFEECKGGVRGWAGKAGRMVGLAERVGCVLGDGQRS